MHPLTIGHTRELFWDNYLVNTSLTNTTLTQHSPRMEEVSIVLDRPWEGDGCDYFSMTQENGVYRLYYLAWQMFNPEATVHTTSSVSVCCIESTDGKNWTRPDLDIVSYPGYEATNILLDGRKKSINTFHAFLDQNPACPADERYKATALIRADYGKTLMCLVSADGYHFRVAQEICANGMFDSQNVAFWSPELGKYLCYIRDFHDYPADGIPQQGIRDIRLITSEDFITWTDPVLLDFGSREDIPLYTNAIFRYPRAPQILVGMPSRYVERQTWSENFDQLTGAKARRSRCRIEPRYGLTVTDCVLMTSRDGLHWNRWEEAWMQPGIERDYNWVYGDCYPAVGVIPTASKLPGAPEELSFYAGERHWSQQPTFLRRYTLRTDGLISMRAGYAPKQLVTKPILYEGGQLHLNFSTSARGYIYVTAKCGGETIQSCELFGDTLDRVVPFNGDPEQFQGKEITLEFVMSDADLYSMQFI